VRIPDEEFEKFQEKNPEFVKEFRHIICDGLTHGLYEELLFGPDDDKKK
jgi:hypothetical protein